LIADWDLEKSFPKLRPLLAHYTSIEALEGIVHSNEFWYSHPLAMNDSEELLFGMQQGASAFRGSQALAGHSSVWLAQAVKPPSTSPESSGIREARSSIRSMLTPSIRRWPVSARALRSASG
jgi:hypothetical protein